MYNSTLPVKNGVKTINIQPVFCPPFWDLFQSLYATRKLCFSINEIPQRFSAIFWMIRRQKYCLKHKIFNSLLSKIILKKMRQAEKKVDWCKRDIRLIIGLCCNDCIESLKVAPTKKNKNDRNLSQRLF